MKSDELNANVLAACDQIEDHLARLSAFVKEKRKTAKAKKFANRGELGDLNRIRESVEEVVPLTS
jgi:hypothetical protein